MELEEVRQGHHPLPFAADVHGVCSVSVMRKSVVIVAGMTSLRIFVITASSVQLIKIPFPASFLPQSHTIRSIHSFRIRPDNRIAIAIVTSKAGIKSPSSNSTTSSNNVSIPRNSSSSSLNSSNRSTASKSSKGKLGNKAYLHIFGSCTPIQKSKGGVEGWLKRVFIDHIGTSLRFVPLCLSSLPLPPLNMISKKDEKNNEQKYPMIVMGSRERCFRVFEILPKVTSDAKLEVLEVGVRSVRYPLVSFIRLPSPPRCFSVKYFRARGTHITRMVVAGCQNGAVRMHVSSLNTETDEMFKRNITTETAILDGPISFIHLFSHQAPPPPPHPAPEVAALATQVKKRAQRMPGSVRDSLEILVGLSKGNAIIFRDAESKGLKECQMLLNADKHDSVLCGTTGDLNLDGSLEIFLGTYSGAVLTYTLESNSTNSPTHNRKQKFGQSLYSLSTVMRLRHPVCSIHVLYRHEGGAGEGGIVCATTMHAIDILRLETNCAVRAAKGLLKLLSEISELERKLKELKHNDKKDAKDIVEKKVEKILPRK